VTFPCLCQGFASGEFLLISRPSLNVTTSYSRCGRSKRASIVLKGRSELANCVTYARSPGPARWRLRFGIANRDNWHRLARTVACLARLAQKQIVPVAVFPAANWSRSAWVQLEGHAKPGGKGFSFHPANSRVPSASARRPPTYTSWLPGSVCLCRWCCTRRQRNLCRFLCR
jgi:hypothetical protein